jgi:hypothetical protein
MLPRSRSAQFSKVLLSRDANQTVVTPNTVLGTDVESGLGRACVCVCVCVYVCAIYTFLGTDV